jgi:hypothetical protein
MHYNKSSDKRNVNDIFQLMAQVCMNKINKHTNDKEQYIWYVIGDANFYCLILVFFYASLQTANERKTGDG